MTFQESENIYSAAEIECDAARDRFILAYEALREAGLLDRDGHVYSPAEVEIGNIYRTARREFAEAVEMLEKSEEQWVRCMQEEDGSGPRFQWN